MGDIQIIRDVEKIKAVFAQKPKKEIKIEEILDKSSQYQEKLQFFYRKNKKVEDVTRC